MNLVQWGIQKSNASMSAIVFSSNPIYIAFLSSLVLKEKINAKKMIGLVIGLMGVGVTFLTKQHMGEDFYIGILLVLMGAVLFAVYTVLTKKIVLEIGSLATNALSFILGCVTMLPWFIVGGVSPFDFSFGEVAWQILYLSICVSGIGYYCYFKALSMVDTSLGSMIFFVKPILASLIAIAVLGEKLTFNLVIGIVLVLIGVHIVRQSVSDAKLDS